MELLFQRRPEDTVRLYFPKRQGCASSGGKLDSNAYDAQNSIDIISCICNDSLRSDEL